MKLKVAVIGSGIGGLAAAVRMAALGFDVDLFEQNEIAGGKLSEIVMSDYRFDTGPSLFTLPEQINELYYICGIPIKDNLNYGQLEVVCRYFYNEDLYIDSFSDPDRFATEVEEKTGEPAVNVLKFLKRSSLIYDLTKDVFIFRSFHDWRTFFSKTFLKSAANWWKLDPLSTMKKSTERAFRSNEVRKLFNRYATYNGSNPYTAPATLNVISHLEHNLGAYFPDMGMYQIVKSLVALGENMNVKYHFNTRVEKVILSKNQVNGIIADGKELAYDLVISDVDVYSFYRNLLHDKKMLNRLSKHELSTSAIVFYWGINKSFPRLKLHNILFAEDYKAEFDHIWKIKDIYHDPTVYIFISSKHVKTDAPDGCENWFVMINTPAMTSLGEHDKVQQVRRHIINKINRLFNTDIEKAIVCESITTPKTLEERTLSFQGAIYGSSSNNKFAAFNRHPNFRKKTRGLYFTGGSVHPGGGIPLCLASAKIVEDRVRKDLKIKKIANGANKKIP
jgi:phytoene desaturase